MYSPFMQTKYTRMWKKVLENISNGSIIKNLIRGWYKLADQIYVRVYVNLGY